MSKINIFRNSQEYQFFSRGQTVFQEGQPGDYMYIIIEGEVDLIMNNRLIARLGAGEIVGEMALLSNSPRSATCVARTNCKVSAIDLQKFTFLVQYNPYFAIQVMQIMAERLRLANANLNPVMFPHPSF